MGASGMGTLINCDFLVSATCCGPLLRPFFNRRDSLPPPVRLVSFSAPVSKTWPPVLSLQVGGCSHRKALRAVVGSSRPDPDEDEGSSKEVGRLPRRSLLVQFTCDACGARTQRLMNRLAYEKGTVFLQCAGCLVYHKFVDNLGLVVEYDIQEELNTDDGMKES